MPSVRSSQFQFREQEPEMNPIDPAFLRWQELNSSPVSNLPLTFFEVLKKSHPLHHVVQINGNQCDLIGYARAGYAKATRDDDDAIYTIRGCGASGSRLENKPKEVVECINFGKWVYTWNEYRYIFYRILYELPGRGSMMSHYVLAEDLKHITGKTGAAAVDLLILASGAWTSELHDEIYVFDDQRWVKDKGLFESVKGSSWDDVILDQTIKKNLITDVEGFFDNQALYKQLSVPWKRGIILHGVPGNGKTISIKALINTLSTRPTPIPSLYVKSFDGECHGPKWAIAAIFSKARQMAPCLLIFEDLDSLVTDKTRSYFLNEVDGLESNDGILMIGSTNHLGKLDPAISKRPSRFDRKYMFKVPSEGEREMYARFWREKLGKMEGGLVEFEFGEELCKIVAGFTEGFSFAYLKELFVVTLLEIARGATGAGDVEDEGVNENGSGTTSASTDDGVVVEKEDSVPDITSSEPATTSSEPVSSATQLEKNTPLPKLDVDIPDHLKDNILLKGLIAQAKMLRDEMDNTNKLVVASKVTGGKVWNSHIGMKQIWAEMHPSE